MVLPSRDDLPELAQDERAQGSRQGGCQGEQGRQGSHVEAMKRSMAGRIDGTLAALFCLFILTVLLRP